MDRSADEAAIRALSQALSDTWGKGDLRALDDLYTPDSDYVTFDGSWLEGLDQNRSIHADLFNGVLAGTRLEGKIEKIRFLTADTAVVISTGALLWPWQKEIPRSRLSRQTLVVVKRDGRWKIASFQNTRVRPMPSLDSPLMKLASAVIRFRVRRWRARLPASSAQPG